MKIFTNNELRKMLGLKKLPPVYYLGTELVTASVKEATGKPLNSLDLADNRPFDEVVLITELEQFKDEPGDSVHIVHFNQEGEYRNFMVLSEGNSPAQCVNTTIREVVQGDTGIATMVNIASRNAQEDAEQIRDNQEAMRQMLLPFSSKKSVISLRSTAVTTHKPLKPKKKIRVNQKYVVVHRPESRSTTAMRGDRAATHAAYPATSVCGHWRVFRKKPQSVGSDRHGNALIGKTWVAPYKRGEGEVILEKIRLWLK